MRKTTSGMKKSSLCHEEKLTLLTIYILLQLETSDEEHKHLVDTLEEVAQHSTAKSSSFPMLRKDK